MVNKQGSSSKNNIPSVSEAVKEFEILFNKKMLV
jgi:hypothetical protein